MPGLVKVGYTLRVPEVRTAELSGSTGVPQPFVLEYWCLTQDPEAVEELVHCHLDQHRLSGDREFFEIAVPSAIAAIDRAVRPAESRFVKRSVPEREHESTPKKCGNCGTPKPGYV